MFGKNPPDDNQLVNRCLRGEQKAYTMLLQKYQQAVFNLCYRLVSDAETAQDLAQESFVKIFNALNQFDPNYRFSSWMFRVVKNHCYDYLRKSKLPQVSLNDDRDDDSRPLQIADTKPTPDQSVFRSERRELIMQAINKLPPDSRTVIILRHMHDKTYDEMANILGEPVGTVKARVHRARKKLTELLSKDLMSD